MDTFVDYLKQRLQHPLPGLEAQLRMAPQPIGRASQRMLKAPADARISGVLVLLFPNEQDDLEVLLTLRSSGINHGGQISFPGGGAEEEETPREAALREAREEVGIRPEQVQVLGELTSLYVHRSNNYVHPVVGYTPRKPTLTIDPVEVEEAFNIELESLLAKGNLKVENWDLRDVTYEVPYWDVHRVPLWGATAMMLSELLALYHKYKIKAGIQAQ